MPSCIFFDRDGIVNRSPGPGYVEHWQDFHLLPEFVTTLEIITRLGFKAVIITNQRGVALGRMTLADVDDIHRRLREVLKTQHHLDLLDIHDRNACDCRKPKPGMLLEAARRHQIDLARSWMIGDSAKDVAAGQAAGCRTILVGDATPTTPPDHHLPDMATLSSSIAKILAAG